MNKEEIKEYLNRVEKLELKLDGEDKETLQLLIYGYNQCAKLLNETEQQNQKYKEVIDKAIEYIEKHLTDKGRFLMLNEWQVPDLLKILKGGKDE